MQSYAISHHELFHPESKTAVAVWPACIRFLPSITLRGSPCGIMPGLHHAGSKNGEQMNFMHDQASHQLCAAAAEAACQGWRGGVTRALSSLVLRFPGIIHDLPSVRWSRPMTASHTL